MSHRLGADRGQETEEPRWNLVMSFDGPAKLVEDLEYSKLSEEGDILAARWPLRGSE